MIIDKARELGIALSESAEFQRMVQARQAMENDQQVTDLLEEFRDKQERVVELLSEDTPDRETVTALTNDVERVQAILLEHPVFSAMLEAQNEFQQLMGRVNSVIGSCIGFETESNSGGCSGSCSSCGGCVH